MSVKVFTETASFLGGGAGEAVVRERRERRGRRGVVRCIVGGVVGRWV